MARGAKGGDYSRRLFQIFPSNGGDYSRDGYYSKKYSILLCAVL